MSVRETLAQLFPEVDRRIISATAREHKDDLEGAVEYIKHEVLTPAEVVEAVQQSSPWNEQKRRDELFQPLEINTEGFEENVVMAIDKKEQLKKAMAEVQKLRILASEAEEEVQLYKLEASLTAEDYLSKSQRLKERVLRRRQQNELREAEIYGERAVLKTEAREAESRLEQVRKEWENAMELTSQCKNALECRIASAKLSALSAREEVLKKEEEARQELLTQELQLVEAEARAKELDRVADECTRVQEFLINRGSVIDSLQGEIAVLVEDVQLLKSKIDGVAAGIYQDSFYAERQEQQKEPVVVAVDEDDRDWQEIEKDMMKTIHGELDAEPTPFDHKPDHFQSSHEANGSVFHDEEVSSHGSFDVIPSDRSEEWFSTPFMSAQTLDGRAGIAI